MDKHKKQFLKDCARYIRGGVNEIKLRGPRKTTRLFANVLKESRLLFIALQTEKKMKVVIPVLESKKRAANLLRDKTGFVWPF